MYTANSPHDFSSIMHDSADGFADVISASVCRYWYWLHFFSPSQAFVYYIPAGGKSAEINVHKAKIPPFHPAYSRALR